MYRRKDNMAVSPVIATILMVAITVVLATVIFAILYGYFNTPKTVISSTPNVDPPGTDNVYRIDGLDLTSKYSLVDFLKVSIHTDQGMALKQGVDMTETSVPISKIYHYDLDFSDEHGYVMTYLDIDDDRLLSNADSFLIRGDAVGPGYRFTVTYGSSLILEATLS